MNPLRKHRLTLRILVGITLLIAASVGLYASHLVRRTHERLLDERSRFHEALLESSLPGVASALWHFDAEALEASLRSTFRSDETLEILLIPEGDSPRLVTRKPQPGTQPETRILPQADAEKALAAARRLPDQRVIRKHVVYSKENLNQDLATIQLVYSTASVASYATSLAREVWLYTSLLCIIMVLATWAFIKRIILDPVRSVGWASRKVLEGTFERAKGPFGRDEIGELGHTFNLMVERLETQTANLHGLLEVVKRQNEELRRASDVKDQILATTSHELRTPLNGIIGASEALLAHSHDRPDDRGSLLLIRQSAKRLEEMVANILHLASLKKGGIPLEFSYTNLEKLIRRVVALQERVRGVRSGVSLRIEVPPDLPAVPADPLRLEQVLSNLVGNAFKFTATGTISISAQNDEKHRCVRVQVSDTGTGIPPEALSSIFLPFVQADGRIQSRHGGSGLGLAIAKAIVELHGGEISVRSQPGVGSTFSFSIPLEAPECVVLPELPLRPVDRVECPEAEASTVLEEASISQVEPESDRECEKPHVLVVDDEPVNRMAFSLMIPARDFKISVASSGQEALDVLKKDTSVGLIISDIMMPEMSGYELCAKIRETHGPLELPIIFVSAKALPEDLSKGFEVGANDYLVKPVHKDELLARLGVQLEMSRRHRWLARALTGTCNIVAAQNRYAAMGRAASLLLNILRSPAPCLVQVVLTPPAESHGSTVRTFKLKLVPRRGSGTESGIPVSSDHLMILLDEDQFTAEIAFLRNGESAENDWVILPLLRGDREAGTLILTHPGLLRLKREQDLMTAIGETLALVLENISHAESASQAQMRNTEQRLRALGHAAMRLGHRINNPLAIIQWANEELEEVARESSHVETRRELENLSRLVGSSTAAIQQAIAELERFKSHANASDSLKDLAEVESGLPQ